MRPRSFERGNGLWHCAKHFNLNRDKHSIERLYIENGLNLHEACRIVVLLHPEWNPGVVEQQIGRVDRVGSHWCNVSGKSIEEQASVEALPRIEVRPVIFRGTYDEFNWQILQSRWKDLRAQLHGEVIPPSDTLFGAEEVDLAEKISNMAPNFSPTRDSPTGHRSTNIG